VSATLSPDDQSVTARLSRLEGRVTALEQASGSALADRVTALETELGPMKPAEVPGGTPTES
jgi:hypothetical protein